MREIVFWLGYNSPYSMFAHHRIEELIAGLDVRVRCRPWFAGVKLPEHDSPRVQYVAEDVSRHVRAYGPALRPGVYVDLSSVYRGQRLAQHRAERALRVGRVDVTVMATPFHRTPPGSPRPRRGAHRSDSAPLG